MSETRRTWSPTTRAASYIDPAVARPTPLSKSRRRSVMIDCEQDRLPEQSRTKQRSPGTTKVCIFWQMLT